LKIAACGLQVDEHHQREAVVIEVIDQALSRLCDVEDDRSERDGSEGVIWWTAFRRTRWDLQPP
jgi:hypothetical protein